MANGKRKIPNLARREVCSSVGAHIGSVTQVKCAKCAHLGTMRWETRYAYWPIVSGLEFDHIVPAALGGSHQSENLQLLCRSCNRRKGVTA